MANTLRTLIVSGLGALVLAVPSAAAAPSARPAGPLLVPALAGGPEEPGFIGITLTEGEGETLVAGVLPGTAAASAGLREGDRLVEVAGTPVAAAHDVFRALEGHPPGDTIVVVVERDGDRNEIEVTLGEQPGSIPAPRRELDRSGVEERLQGLVERRSEASERWNELLERHTSELRSELEKRAEELREGLEQEDGGRALRERLEGAVEHWREARARELDRLVERMRALVERERRPDGLLQRGGLGALGRLEPLPGFYAPEIRVPEMDVRIAPIAPRFFDLEDAGEREERNRALEAMKDELGSLRGEVEALRNELSELRAVLRERSGR